MYLNADGEIDIKHVDVDVDYNKIKYIKIILF